MKMPFQSVDQLTRRELRGKKVLVRLDTNVSFVDGAVADPSRLIASVPTIDFLIKAGVKQIFIIGHVEHKASLRPVAGWLRKKYALDFVADSEEARVARNQIVLLENLRHDPREEKNDLALAYDLANLADHYINDAFSVSHRTHTSIISVPKLLPTYAGLRFVTEYEALVPLLSADEPTLLILGGAKFKTKLPVIEAFLPKAKNIFIGGALAHVFFRKKKWEIGRSLIDDQAKLSTTILKSKKNILPLDVVVIDRTSPRVKLASAVESNETIVDAGPETIKLLTEQLKNVKRVIWNGPIGNYEANFIKGTRDLAQAIISSGVYSVVGGGDTLAALAGTPYLNQFSFVSLAGGAMLEFLATGTLPGIKALTLKRRR
ncbi:MAG: phosphoglycerate kinase [Candidatus Vogelbacteria bacterium]|nr:phosphoglycerate kinase [Candidatus Vogelbacteria bacterium]